MNMAFSKLCFKCHLFPYRKKNESIAVCFTSRTRAAKSAHTFCGYRVSRYLEFRILRSYTGTFHSFRLGPRATLQAPRAIPLSQRAFLSHFGTHDLGQGLRTSRNGTTRSGKTFTKDKVGSDQSGEAAFADSKRKSVLEQENRKTLQKKKCMKIPRHLFKYANRYSTCGRR